MIKIGLLLDACGIGYTEGQLLKLKKIVEKCIEQHIYKAVKEITSKKSFAKTDQIDEATSTSVKNEPVIFPEVEATTSTKSEPYVLGDALSNSGDTLSNSGDTLSNSGDTLSNSEDNLPNTKKGSLKRVVDNEFEESLDTEDITNEQITNM